MGVSIRMLDHGYVQLIESWGSDEAVIEAARMSTQKEIRLYGETVRLMLGLGFPRTMALYEEAHSS